MEQVNKRMLEKIFVEFTNELSFKKNEVDQLPPLVLAYVGDSVYELFVRTFLIKEISAPVHTLHKKSVNYVKAKAQSDIIHRIKDLLTEEEGNVVRRGRNAKSGTIPKNADVTEYKHATGFEALIGYLYLNEEYDRLIFILRAAISGGK